MSRAAPPLPPEAATLSAQLERMMALVGSRSDGDTLAIMNDAGLTMTQIVCLHVLDHGGGHTVGQVSDRLHLSPAATSHMVERLVRAGLAARAESPDDRRIKVVRITAEGRALVTRIQEERAREVTQVVARLSPTLRKQFLRVVSQVVEELAAQPGPAIGPGPHFVPDHKKEAKK